MSSPARLDAVVFDLDGTLVDTEVIVHRSIEAVFEDFGLDFPADRWARLAVGKVGHFDWRDELAERADRPVDRAAVTEHQQRVETDLMRSLTPRDGAAELVSALTAAGVRMAAASNSKTGWVRQQLERVGLVHHFSALYGRDRVAHPKPAPDVYDAAARGIGADPHWTVAIEDSATGLAAAVAAGLVSIACPGPMTENLDFSAAHRRVGSLAELDPDGLRALVAEVRGTDQAPSAD